MSTPTTLSPKARRSEEEILAELTQYFPDNDIEEVFVRDMHELTTEKGLCPIEACIHFAEKRGIEVTILVPIIRRNLNLMSKITVDAENLNYIKKVPRLPI